MIFSVLDYNKNGFFTIIKSFSEYFMSYTKITANSSDLSNKKC